jgi:cytochrome c-type biogenesis protein CcmF
VISVTAVETYTTERDVALARGESIEVGGYDFRFDGIDDVHGPNYDGVHGIVQVSREGRPIATLHPEKRRYFVQQSVMTEAGIESQAGRDLFVALGEDLGAGRWSLRIQVRPLINYVWLAALLMALGGCIAASDRRYRTARAPATVPVGAGQGSTA